MEADYLLLVNFAWRVRHKTQRYSAALEGIRLIPPRFRSAIKKTPMSFIPAHFLPLIFRNAGLRLERNCVMTNQYWEQDIDAFEIDSGSPGCVLRYS